MSRRLVGSVTAALVVTVSGGALLIGNARADRRPGSATNGSRAAARQTAHVTKKDLAETQDVSGTLGYGAQSELSFGGHGVITALPSVGSVVDRGGELGEVDGQRVTLLLGDRPMWRDLHEGVTDGPDVAQLEANLVALGYAKSASVGPNQTWSVATTDAVKRWQHATGQAETGAIDLGRLVFLPAAVRVAEQVSPPGSNAGGPALKVSGTARQVAIDLDAKYQSLVKVGQTVQVELPDGTTTPATTTSVGSVAHAAQQGQDPTIPVVATLRDPSVGRGLDQAPVTVHVVTNQAAGVLAVPVGALLALAEGGYAVERVTGPTTTTLVGVKLGTFADGWVEVSGDVHEGDQVIVAQ